MRKNILIIIDPQYDFCNQDGSLFVNGAERDMENLSKFLLDKGSLISTIFVTLDSHTYQHINHQGWWEDKTGNNPEAFSEISYEDVAGFNPIYRPINSKWLARSIEYLGITQKIMVYPPHCISGSPGAAICEPVYRSLVNWQVTNKESYLAIHKGLDPFTDNLSPIMSLNGDLNNGILEMWKDLPKAYKVIITGEALTHCVKSTVEDIKRFVYGDSDMGNVYLLEDTMSPVYGFEDLGAKFLREDAPSLGINVCRTSEVF